MKLKVFSRILFFLTFSLRCLISVRWNSPFRPGTLGKSFAGSVEQCRGKGGGGKTGVKRVGVAGCGEGVGGGVSGTERKRERKIVRERERESISVMTDWSELSRAAQARHLPVLSSSQANPAGSLAQAGWRWIQRQSESGSGRANSLRSSSLPFLSRSLGWSRVHRAFRTTCFPVYCAQGIYIDGGSLLWMVDKEITNSKALPSELWIRSGLVSCWVVCWLVSAWIRKAKECLCVPVGLWERRSFVQYAGNKLWTSGKERPVTLQD